MKAPNTPPPAPEIILRVTEHGDELRLTEAGELRILETKPIVVIKE